MADNIQTKSEAALVKKVGDIANVLAAAGVGFTDYLTQILYPIFDYPHEHYTFKHFEV